MRRLIILAFVGSVMLSACATTADEHLKAGQAISVATTSLDAAAKAADALVVAGITTKSENQAIAAYAPKARDSLAAATSAYKANQDATAEQNAAQAAALAAQILTIVEAHK
jgi:hypothetical protein